ncbi:hypothetical protein ABC337_04935 [Arthrobacter sp. 1P04PC]|uniref:hypothetical protein n=1 Tax=unclassified Arthrobacter TaxID=235627 RepID=UPI0039A29761
MLAKLEEYALFVSIMTGIKAQYVNAGWSEHAAEIMTIEMLRNVTAQEQGGRK